SQNLSVNNQSTGTTAQHMATATRISLSLNSSDSRLPSGLSRSCARSQISAAGKFYNTDSQKKELFQRCHRDDGVGQFLFIFFTPSFPLIACMNGDGLPD